jgi:hypothetical protein
MMLTEEKRQLIQWVAFLLTRGVVLLKGDVTVRRWENEYVVRKANPENSESFQRPEDAAGGFVHYFD